MRRIVAMAVLLALAGCGAREPLRRAPGQEPPPRPVQAPAAPSAAELLAVPVDARPERLDEPLRRSEPREDDRFDLPPPE